MALAGPPLYGAKPCSLSGSVVGGRYEILGSLARGGMAEVFLAKQKGIEGFEKLVAVKTIAGRRSDDEYFVAMFLDEARTAGDLRHPNVVQTYEAGVDDDTYFIAMEFLHGSSLSRIMKNLEKRGHTVPFDVAVQIIRECAAGLHHAHTKTDLQGRPLGIVHRDVSPQNVIVTVDGVTKIVDFGIALHKHRSIVTSTGGLKGKYPYMSPEQAEGAEKLDARSDLFALGVMLWEMTVGRPLFRRDNEIKTLDAVRECKPPPPSTFMRGYPQPLEDAVLMMLAKDVDGRPRDCAAVVALLEDVEHQVGFVPRASRLALFLQEATAEVSAAELANAKTALGPISNPARAASSSNPDDPVTVESVIALPSSSPPLGLPPPSSSSSSEEAPASSFEPTRDGRSPSGRSGPNARVSRPDARPGSRPERERVITSVGDGGHGLTSIVQSRRTGARLAVAAVAVAAVVVAVAVLLPSGTAPAEIATEAPPPPPPPMPPPPPPTTTTTTTTAPTTTIDEPDPVPGPTTTTKGPTTTTTKGPTTTTTKGPKSDAGPATTPTAPVTTFGKIFVPASDPYVNVKIDDDDLGPSPVTRKVTVGKHRVRLTAANSNAVVVDAFVDVAEDKPTTVKH